MAHVTYKEKINLSIGETFRNVTLNINNDWGINENSVTEEEIPGLYTYMMVYWKSSKNYMVAILFN